MKDPSYLIIFREHRLNPEGINSGAEMATLNLARALARNGKEVVLCAYIDGAEREWQGVRLWNLGPDFNVKGALQRARQLGSYHLISAGRALPISIAREEASCVTTSLITHDRTSGDSGISPKTLDHIVDTIFCVSNAQREIFIKDGVSSDKLVVLHNGVDLELFKAGAVDERDYRKLIFVGALIVDKGIHLLIESFAKLKAKYRDLTLDVYGSAALWDRADFIDTADIERRLSGIKFHGNVTQPEIARALGTAGLCVVPSIWFDPFPLVSIDAQSCGCPVVAFDVGGLKEGIENGKTGVVVSDVSEPALTATIDQLLGNSAQLRAMSENCLRIVRGRYTWERLAIMVTTRCDLMGARESNLARRANSTRRRIGLMTTWNQRCGLATYGRYLADEFPAQDITILAEHIREPLTAEDGENVIRCWRRDDGSYDSLLQTIKEGKLDILYLNCHYRFFVEPHFSNFLKSVSRLGIKTVAHLHSTFTYDTRFVSLNKAVDALVVHSVENRLEAIANGADPDRVFVVPHGVHASRYINDDQQKLRAEMGLPQDKFIVSTFGFVQPHKGMEGVIEAVAALHRKGVPICGYILGGTSEDDPASRDYLSALKQAASVEGVSQQINFIDRFLEDDEVSKYLSASDLVLMNYKSQHYEASGAGALALGSGAVVITSLAPQFQQFGDAVWHLSSGYPIALSIELLLSNPTLREVIQSGARRYIWANSWTAVKEKIESVFDAVEMLAKADDHKEREQVIESGPITGQNTSPPSNQPALKVLMQNRKNALIQRGGDTVVMEQTKVRLEKLGVKVTVDLEAKEDPANYDIVHLFNFALPQMVKFYGERALEKGVPFVVTTLYENIPEFHNQSISFGQQLIAYVNSGQDRTWYDRNRIDLKSIRGCPHFDNTWAAENAACLIVNGEAEAETIKRDYQTIKNISVVPVGHEIGAAGNADEFYRAFGVKDFVLCVGRLETRKNQLMLLKALEDIDIPVVLASGGFTYQPDYENAVRNFKRRGKTLVLDRLSPEMLASAYKAAKIHALVSWYELPGLVSLEAAYYQRNVVVTDRGTARDYFGDKAFYCDPGSESSIQEAVLAAYNSPAKTGLKEVAMKYSWDNAGDQTLETYKKVLGGPPQQAEASPVVIYDLESGATDFQDLLERGEMAARSKDFAKANDLLAQAERLNPRSGRLVRARGAVYLAEGQVELARQYFERGVLIEPSNAKMHSGLGMCATQLKDFDAAHGFFSKALEYSPADLVAILQLIECSYVLDRYDNLETVLRRYVTEHPRDFEMLYCLAGCLFKRGQLEEAERMALSVQAQNSDHLGAKQLLSVIADSRNASAATLTENDGYRPSITLTDAITPIAPQPAASIQAAIVREPGPAAEFNRIDEELSEIEELKRKKDYSQVRNRCGRLLNGQGLTNAQKERATLLTAEALVLQGEIQESEKLFDTVLGDNPRSARALCGKGAIVANRNDWESARGYFEKARVIDPAYDVPWAGLGVYHYSANRLEEAWDSFKQAIQINPENVRALLGIIDLGYRLRRLTEVEGSIKSYLEMHPLDLEFVYSLAGCYFAQDRLNEAMEELNKIALFDPKNARAAELREMITAKSAAPGASA